MDKKFTRAGRRRPLNLNLKAATLRAEQLSIQANRESADLTIIQPTQPVFASVHRPRHASISAIKRDNPSMQTGQHHKSNSTFQHKNATFDVVYLTGRSENGNSSLASALPIIGQGKMPENTAKHAWQGSHHNHQHHQAISVPMPQPFHQHPVQTLVTGAKLQRGVSCGVIVAKNSGFSHQPLLNHLQQSNQQSTLAQHRFSTVQQNFNHISKTATNLLNDIYEKHLLNQTTFENITVLNGRTAGMPLGMTAVTNVAYGDMINNVNTSAEDDFNLNNFHLKQQIVKSQSQQQQINKPPCPQQIQQHQHKPLSGIVHQHQRQIHLPEHHQQQQPMLSKAFEDLPEQHVYETIDAPLQPPPTSLTSKLLRKRISSKIQKSSKNASQDGKSGGIAMQKKPIVVLGVNDESHVGSNHFVHNQNQNQNPVNQHFIHHHYNTPYIHHTRTRADGQSVANEGSTSTNNNTSRCKSKVTDAQINPEACVSSSIQPSDVVIDKYKISADIVHKVREVPIGSLNQEGFNDAVTPSVHHRSTEETNFQNHSTGKYSYRNGKINLMLETAQAVAAAAYYAKAATKVVQSGTSSKSRSTDMPSIGRNGGYCGALQRAPPPLPAGLARRLANKENYGIGRVKVMLRVSDNREDQDAIHFMAIDKKKRQVTLTDPSTTTATTSQERAPMVSAPKMFAFDGLFTTEDSQTDVCAAALAEVIPAVLEGSDGCLLSIGYPHSGQSKTMLGTLQAPHDLGAIPCAISWLYKGINERRQKSGARFSVRVSALGVSATKPESSSKDLLAAHATDSDESPGVYLRDDFLGGPTELRAPTAERAALFLDAALAGRPQSGLEPAMIFTLHVYQYSLSGKGGVAGGRSRLHLIDLGGCANRSGGLPLSGIGNVLLAILSGQRHPPNKDHPLTPLLKDCLAPLTCHVTIMAHVSHAQAHADSLTTIQLASRIHRMRRRKHRFPIPNERNLGVGNTGHQSGGSSDGPDPSSSDLSADTVIYMGPCDDATDGEHPPVYLPSLSSGDNRCAMNKILKGTAAEKPSKLPTKRTAPKPQSPIAVPRTDSLKRSNLPSLTPATPVEMPIPSISPAHNLAKPTSTNSSPKIVAGVLRHANAIKTPNSASPKSSPLRRQPNTSNPESPLRQISEEHWIDGPRVSRSKVAEARHLLREINHVKQCETWIDGPKSTTSKTLVAANLPGSNQTAGYGFMDSHKKTMIRQWVENQSSHVFQSNCVSSNQLPQQQQQTQTALQSHHHQQTQPQPKTATTYHLTLFHKKSEEDQNSFESNPEVVNLIDTTISNLTSATITLADCSVRSSLKSNKAESDVHSIKSGLSNSLSNCQDPQEEEDQDSGPSEVPPALPLIEPLSSREISHESLQRIISRHVSRESLSANQMNTQTIDCGLQVTEEEIARTMGCEHPLSALSHGNMSIVSSFNIGDAFSDCAIGERTRNQFDQLARLREIFTSQLAMAEVTPAFRIGDSGSVYSEPAIRFNTAPGSVCSEPPYRPPSPRCRGCRQSLTISPSPSQTSLPSLNGIMTIAGMEQYASLRHPDGASDPNLPKVEKAAQDEDDDEVMNEKSELLMTRSSLDTDDKILIDGMPIIAQNQISQLPLLPLSTSEAYDSGHDSSTPRTSKHSGISRRAESGYHSVATARDSDESSFTSGVSKDHNRISMKKKRHDKSLCNWLRNPFTCAYPETEGEISDF